LKMWTGMKYYKRKKDVVLIVVYASGDNLSRCLQDANIPLFSLVCHRWYDVL